MAADDKNLKIYFKASRNRQHNNVYFSIETKRLKLCFDLLKMLMDGCNTYLLPALFPC